jgi:chromosome partitioning protein
MGQKGMTSGMRVAGIGWDLGITSRPHVQPLGCGPRMKPYIVAIFNQKGGISKTTTSTNLAVCLAAAGKSVVLIDLDSQGDSTKSLGVDPETRKGIYDAFIGDAEIDDILMPTAFDGVDILPSTYNLAGIEIKLSEVKDSQRTLVHILGRQNLDCDYVIVDCPPALGILPINALAASHAVIIPVTATPYANDGLMRTLPSIKYVQEGLNKALLLQGVLFTINDRSKTNRHINTLIRSRLGGTVYRAEIPRDNHVIEAASAHLPVCAYAPLSPAARAHLDFAYEFMERHAHTASKAGIDFKPPRPIDQAIRILAGWREGHAQSLPQPQGQTIKEGKSRLDRLLYGNHTLLERLHLSMIHFFIENKFVLFILIVIFFTTFGLLVSAGVARIQSATNIFTLPVIPH